MKKIYALTLLPAALFLLASFLPLDKGDHVPDFTAMDENGKEWKLSDQRAAYLVIYFYPAAFTGGCTKQACSYRDHSEEYKKLHAKVIGISGDEFKNLGSFKSHYNLDFTLLSDNDGRIAGLFGVPTRDGASFETEVDGQTLQVNRSITASRWTFVLDVNGRLIYKDEHVSAATDPETVLTFLRTHDARKSCMPRR